MAEHDDARQASRQCTRASGALTRVRRACLWRAQRAVPTSTDPMGILKSTREFNAPGAGKEHTSAVRGGGRDSGVEGPALVSVGRQHARSSFVPQYIILSCRVPLFCFIKPMLGNRYGPGSILKAGDLGWPDPHPPP